MRYTWEDSIKARLTDRSQLIAAVEKLMERGVSEELIPVRLTRVFYVDLDELNFVLQQVMRGEPEPRAPEEPRFRAVA